MGALSVVEGIGTITIANPIARNALDDRTRRAVVDALREACNGPACTSVVIVGEGETFCSGGDLASMPTDPDAVRTRLGEMHEIIRLIHGGPKPAVAAVDGAAFGSGAALAAACDYVVATDRAKFGFPFGEVGLVADTGLLWTLPRRVGWATARRWLLENARVDATVAAASGLVDEVVAVDELVGRARALAGAFASCAPQAVAATRRLLSRPVAGLDDLLVAEMEAQVELLATDEFRTRRDRFFETRASRRKDAPTNDSAGGS